MIIFTLLSLLTGARTKTMVTFCDCVTDPVRLVLMGYIPGSIKSPVTAFSIRLLRFYHTIWLKCASSIQGFTTGLDSFLDEHNPQILGKTGRVRF